ncbi:PhoH family protein [Candidatus Sumerlaeota bacterium]|nr:PhoH family protein [Candidatus Sumerlaeota bacterium]MBI3737100.1 PhoH family protein [Candidatus Sumerlaeota bacterium]
MALAPKVQKVITLSQNEILAFCGDQDRKLRKIQGKLRAKVIPRGNEIRLTGAAADVETAYKLISGLLSAQRDLNTELTDRQIHHALIQNEEFPENGPNHVQELLGDGVALPNRRSRLTPLTGAQRHYISAMREKDVVFCIGPAGTGKTYLAMAMAVSSLTEGKVDRIILVRPVVEAGEHLGFLPGDISQKFDPYVRPLYDALYEMMEAEKIREFIDNGTIEIAPLAFMRGRTMNNSFVILDEAQNTSIEQMKMFLTRMGFESKLVITGDVTQVDLPRNKLSGLAHVEKILAGIPEIEFIHFTRKDVVRNQLVQKIIHAYESHGQK